MEKPTMEYSIQQVSEMLGIPIQKLRRWDELGVLTAARTEGGHRRYSKELVDRLLASALNAGDDKPANKSTKELEAVRKSLAEKHRVIQLLLGHRSIRTTLRYTRVTPRLIATTTSPVDVAAEVRKQKLG